MPPTRRLLVAIVVFVATTLTANAGITLNPPQPQAGQPFRIVVSGDWGDTCVPELRRTLIANDIVYATFGLSGEGGCLPAGIFFEEVIDMPALSAGTYTLRTRLIEFDEPQPFFESTFTVAGAPSAITSVTPSFDHNAGNRVVVIRGTFPCAQPGGCSPQVFFGSMEAEDVEQVSETEIHATAPWQTNVRNVDIRVEGPGYEHVRHGGFQYVDGVTFVPIMLPVITRSPVAGAHGSLWHSELRMVNRTKLELVPGIDIFPLEPRCNGCDAPIPFDRMIEPRLAMPLIDNDRPPVQLVWIDEELADSLSFSLRVRDLSRHAESWGTEIPIVENRDFAHEIRLLDIPMQPRFRQLLRIYTPSYVGCCRTRVRFYAPDGTQLTETPVELIRPNGSLGGLVPPPYLRDGSRNFPLQPAYAELDLAAIPELAGQTSIWLEVDASFRIWGFVSITNDTTQQVTTITPQ